MKSNIGGHNSDKADEQRKVMDEIVGGSGGVAGTGAVCASVPVVVRDLVKTYGAIKAVDHISFKLEPGTTVALLGGNGAGKTTTIAMLLGLVMPTAGEVRVFGADMARDRGAVAHRMNFQSPYVDLPMRLTVRENLTVYAGLYGVANKAQQTLFNVLKRDGSTCKMLDQMQTRAELYATIGLHDYEALDASIVRTIVPAGMPER